ncbi:MAG TPA: hypothetical protein VKX35_08760 [Fermentimonas sp.]|nr:hypothetical protein [Fermentimonas sp.]
MIRVRYTRLKLLYPILFTLYVCSFTLFTHTHIINNIKYVHSHPFKINETSNHEHTEKELQLLDQIFNTSLTSEILPKIDLSGNLPEYRHLYTNFYQYIYQKLSAISLRLRAPPAF